jgi:hypothetical protein
MRKPSENPGILRHLPKYGTAVLITMAAGLLRFAMAGVLQDRFPLRHVLSCGGDSGGLGRTRTRRTQHTLIGCEIPTDGTAAPIRDREGNAIGAVPVFRDISERRRQEQGFAAGGQRLRLAVDAGRISTGGRTRSLYDKF